MEEELNDLVGEYGLAEVSNSLYYLSDDIARGIARGTEEKLDWEKATRILKIASDEIGKIEF